MNYIYDIRCHIETTNGTIKKFIEDRLPLRLDSSSNERELIFDILTNDYHEFINIVDCLAAQRDELESLKVIKVIIYLGVFTTGEANLEFDPVILRKLSQNNITLCISCYSLSEDAFEKMKMKHKWDLTSLE